MTWPHNGQKYFFRFFRLRMTQFEKINEKKNSKILKFLKKILSLKSRDLIKGKNRVKKIFISFLESECLNSYKKAKKIFFNFLTLGDWPYDVIRMECAPIEGQGIFGRRVDLHSSKGLYQSYLLRDFQQNRWTQTRAIQKRVVFDP